METNKRTKDDYIALETLDKLETQEATLIATHAMEIDEQVEGIDAIDAVTLLMKLGQYMTTHAGVKK